MKKLLMLLVFSASFFASAQTISFTIAELTGPTGDRLTHLFHDDYADVYEYSGGWTKTASSTFSLSDAGVFFYEDTNYDAIPSWEANIRAYLGAVSRNRNGVFYRPGERVPYPLQPRFFLADSDFDPLREAGWIVDTEHDTQFWKIYCGEYALRISYTSRHGSQGFEILAVENVGNSRYPLGSVLSGAPFIYGQFSDNVGTDTYAFQTAQEAIDVADTYALNEWNCADCTNTDSMGGVINALIIAAEPNYEAQGNGIWIDRDLRPNGFAEPTWNQIEIDEEARVFILEVGAAGDGAVGTRTTYRCLEDLLDNLPQ